MRETEKTACKINLDKLFLHSSQWETLSRYPDVLSPNVDYYV